MEGPLIRMDRALLDALLAEERLEHMERRRCSRGPTVTAVLDQRTDHERGLVDGAVPAPPRLVEQPWISVAGVEKLLCRSGLPRDGDRERPKDRSGGAERRVRRFEESLSHDRESGCVDVRRLRRRRRL